MPIQNLVSIITVNYNGFQDTCNLIDSLSEYETHPFEIIVVDNASKVNEAGLLSVRYPNITAIRSEKNLGFAGGNNLGIKASKGKYIFLLNNDTVLLKPILSTLLLRLESSDLIAVVSPLIRFESDPSLIQYAGFTELSKITLRNNLIGYKEIEKPDLLKPQPTAFAHGAAMILKRHIIEEVGYMPEDYFLYYEEMDWCTSIKKAGYSIWFEPAVEIYHKESASTGVQSPLKAYFMTRNRLLYAKRNLNRSSGLLSIIYQLLIALPKSMLYDMFQGNFQLLNPRLKGASNFIIKYCLLLMLFVFNSCLIQTYDTNTTDKPKEEVDINTPICFLPEQITGKLPVKITITSSDKININNVKAGITPLKYNKRFSYSFTGDDSSLSIYNWLFKNANGMWIEGASNYHDWQPRTPMGYYPPGKWTYTDGCGNDIPFKFGIALSIYNPSGVEMLTAAESYPYENISWSEAGKFLDFGNGLYNHGGAVPNSPEVEDAYYSLILHQTKIHEKIRYFPSTMIQPGGSILYTEAAKLIPYFQLLTYQEEKMIDIQSLNSNLLTEQGRRYVEPQEVTSDAINSFLDRAYRESDDNHSYWIHDFTHMARDVKLYNSFAYLNKTYGKEGLDNIGVASTDEIMQYNYLKQNVNIKMELINEKELTITINSKNNIPAHFIWKQLTLIVEGVVFENPIIKTKNISGLSYKSSNDKLMINFDFNQQLEKLANKYLLIAKRDKTKDARNDALYFINQLKPEFRKDFLNLLNQFVQE